MFCGARRLPPGREPAYGLFDLDGTSYTDYVFDSMEPFDESGLAWAMKAGKWGRIDLDGRTVTEFRYDTLEMAKNPVNVQILSKGGLFAIADLNGKLRTDYDYWNARPFKNSYAAIQDNQGNWGYIDGDGNQAVPCRYYADISGMGDFGTDGFAIVYDYNGDHVVDTTGRDLFPEGVYKVWRAGHGLWGVYMDGGIGFADKDGNMVIEPQYTYYTSPKNELYGGKFDDNGVAEVYTAFNHSSKIYIDTAGNIVEGYDPTTTWERFYEGLEKADNDDFRWGFRDEAGNLIVPFIYDGVGDFDHGWASVRADGVYGMLENPILNSSWAAAEVAEAKSACYVTDRCNFYQTDHITRLQFAELAVNYLEKTTGSALLPAKEDTFTDTTDKVVLKAYAAGIVQGRGENVFDPTGQLTRQELAAMLYRTLTKAEVKFTESADLAAYADGGDVADWAVEALSALVAAKSMKGTGENSLSPKQPCTVEEAILLVYRSAQ